MAHGRIGMNISQRRHSPDWFTASWVKKATRYDVSVVMRGGQDEKETGEKMDAEMR